MATNDPACRPPANELSQTDGASIAITKPRHSAVPEWTPLRCLLVGWPARPDTWRQNAGPARRQMSSFVQLVLRMTCSIDVVVVVDRDDDDAVQSLRTFIQSMEHLQEPTELSELTMKDEESRLEVAATASKYGLRHRLSMLCIPMDDCWMRDVSPIWVASTSHADPTNTHGLTKMTHRKDDDNVCHGARALLKAHDDSNYHLLSKHEAVLRGVCFGFNAWGGATEGCYTNCERDQEVASLLCDEFGIPKMQLDFVMEGGAITLDGQGTAIVTEQCVLNRNRNPIRKGDGDGDGDGDVERLSKRYVERLLYAHLGVTTVLWIPYGLANDHDTDGHVDNMALFIRPRHVLLAWTTEGPNAARCAAARHVLENSVDASGYRLTVHTVCVPPAVQRSEDQALWQQDVEHEVVNKKEGQAKPRPVGEMLCASYVNIVQVERAVFVPAFGFADADRQARSDIQAAFDAAIDGNDKTGTKTDDGGGGDGGGDGRRYRTVAVDASEFILAGGGLHCLTQTIPVVPAIR